MDIMFYKVDRTPSFHTSHYDRLNKHDYIRVVFDEESYFLNELAIPIKNMNFAYVSEP